MAENDKTAAEAPKAASGNTGIVPPSMIPAGNQANQPHPGAPAQLKTTPMSDISGAEAEKRHIEGIKGEVSPKETLEAGSAKVEPVSHSIPKLNVRQVARAHTQSIPSNTAEVTLNFEVPPGKDAKPEDITESRA